MGWDCATPGCPFGSETEGGLCRACKVRAYDALTESGDELHKENMSSLVAQLKKLGAERDKSSARVKELEAAAHKLEKEARRDERDACIAAVAGVFPENPYIPRDADDWIVSDTVDECIAAIKARGGGE